jgi:ferredoxin/flavodoxin---NADP+ reductase
MKSSADILQAGRGQAARRRSAAGASPVLLERRAVTCDLLRLRLSRPAEFTFRPGQHVKMGVAGLLRTYSLASAPHEDWLEFFVELYPGGRLSERLRRLGPGAAMALGPTASGDLRLNTARVNQLLIATVTGIAPFVSMLRAHVRQPQTRHRFFILHGASHGDEFGYASELAALMARDPVSFFYLPTVSRPDSPRNRGWQGARGRVESLAGALVERFRLGPRDTAVLACGHPAMVRTVSRLFTKLGYSTGSESFT